MATPASRYRPSPRPFPDRIPEWEYPASYIAIHLNDHGQMHWQGRRWDVSRALQNQTVGLEVIGDSALVYFYNTPVQELHLKTGTTVALPVDPFRSLPC